MRTQKFWWHILAVFNFTPALLGALWLSDLCGTPGYILLYLVVVVLTVVEIWQCACLAKANIDAAYGAALSLSSKNAKRMYALHRVSQIIMHRKDNEIDPNKLLDLISEVVHEACSHEESDGKSQGPLAGRGKAC